MRPDIQSPKVSILNPEPTSCPTVIGILYPGEMGAALAEIFQANGLDVITTLDGRSSRSKKNCERSGISTCECLTDVVRSADIVFSTVTPISAVAVAKKVKQEAVRLDRSLIYVDANSVSPQAVRRIADEFQGSDIQLLDVAIHGLASRLRTQGTIFLSGSSAGVVARLFASEVRTRILGNEPGNASLMKMMLGGMSKGIIGLFLQSSLLAKDVGMTDEFCEELGHYYPDVMSFVERSLPTYAKHAGRRAQEMLELEKTLGLAGLPTGMAVELSALFSTLALSEPDTDSHTGTQERLTDVIADIRLPVMHSETKQGFQNQEER